VLISFASNVFPVLGTRKMDTQSLAAFGGAAPIGAVMVPNLRPRARPGC
jgi:hypothetical protein